MQSRTNTKNKRYSKPNTFKRERYLGLDGITAQYAQRVFAGSGRVIDPKNLRQIDLMVRGFKAQGLMNSLISYWMFGENVNSDNRSGLLFDLMPTANNLSAAGITATTRPTKSNDLAEFTSALQTRYLIGSNSTLQNQDSFSFACWFRAKQIGTRRFVFIKGNATSANSDEYTCELNNVNTLNFYAQSVSAGSVSAARVSITSLDWIFGVFRYDHPNRQASISLNGDNLTFGTAIPAFTPLNNSQNFAVATSNFTIFSDLYVKNLGFWKRLLTQAEINWLYNNTFQ